jgi:hypothetical protein
MALGIGTRHPGQHGADDGTGVKVEDLSSEAVPVVLAAKLKAATNEATGELSTSSVRIG